MNTIYKHVFSLMVCLLLVVTINFAQDCVPIPGQITYVGGTVNFNYGASSKVSNPKRTGSIVLGEPVVEQMNNEDYVSELGFYGLYLLPPRAPFVTASQGEYLDRIQITWNPEKLGGSATDGFNLYRDGIFLGTVDPGIRNYNDFNVIAGKPYIYSVRAKNIFGEGPAGEALGFMVPNGVVTGLVETVNNNPVPNTIVSLTPMQGFSAKFANGQNAGSLANVSKPFMPSSGDWSVTFWVQSDYATNAGTILEIGPLKFYALHNSIGNLSLVFRYYDFSIANALGGEVMTASENEWHHVSLTHSSIGNRTTLLIDGKSADEKSIDMTTLSGDLKISDGWNGKIDELRIYNKSLTAVDLPEVMEYTASSSDEDLRYYWKMDEELGNKCFDIVNRHIIYLCGATFSADKPNVHTAGKTNEDGYYKIDGVSYGTGTTFIAKPSKNFYNKRSLFFNKNEQDWAALPDFPLTSHATIEMWVKPGLAPGDQTIMSKAFNGNNEFRLNIGYANSAYNFGWDFEQGGGLNFGNIPSNAFTADGYVHLAFTIDSIGPSSAVISAYANGVKVGNDFTTNQFSVFNIADADGWKLGKRVKPVSFLYFDGFIDELAVYDGHLSPATLQNHIFQGTNVSAEGLKIYFALDEGDGINLNNSGSFYTAAGDRKTAEWSIITSHQVSSPHEFTPATRQVTLNPSNTSVDRIDFTDRSTIPVSGYVRYNGTDCFQEKVEILVNGESFSPPVYTDSIGKFIIDFDPGKTAILTPVYKDHTFLPASWEVVNLSTPIAGILFNNTLTHKISGKIAGGDCKLPIINLSNPNPNQNTVCIVKASSTDGCFSRTIQLDNEEGNFVFDNLPPLPNMVISVIEHSDPDVKAAFQTLGGNTYDISEHDTTTQFIYYAEPMIEVVAGFEPYSNTCPVIVMEKGNLVTLKLKLKEQYYGGACYLDTAHFRIVNAVADTVVELDMSGPILTYKFKVGSPNPSFPHTKNIQILASNIAGNNTELSQSVIVTGIRAKDNTFTTVLPETPFMVLRDPPGDRSYSYIEKDKEFCKSFEFSNETFESNGIQIIVDLVPNFTVEVIEIGGEGGPVTTIGSTISKVNERSFEICSSISEILKTSEDDLVVGAQGGDLFLGGALNVEFGFVDIISFDTTNCIGLDSQALNIIPGNFATTFMYTEWHIKNTVLYYLEELKQNAINSNNVEDSLKYHNSITRWNKILSDNLKQKNKSTFVKNVSYASGATYESSITSETSSGTLTEVTKGEQFEIDLVGLAYIAGVGGGLVKMKTSESYSRNTSENENSNTITTGYVIDDDDVLDAFSIDILLDSTYNTPVFKTRVGQSSCPWEPGTAKREGVYLESVDGPIRTDVPADQPAVYHFIMHNTSATNETWTYAFTAGPESNPHSAKIFCNGAPMNQIQWYAIPWGESIPVTVTLERGPVEYDYDDLEIVLYSACEDQRANDLGILPDTAQNLYSAVYISAHFIRPCSEVKITVPEQDFVVFPDPLTSGSDDVRRITVSGYDLTEPNFQLIRVQYRRVNGDGAWINIQPDAGTSYELYNPNWDGYTNQDTLQPQFTHFFWNTTGLADGEYEIRAVTVCTGDVANRPGASEIIKGRIDREPPRLFGVPQPSDGVFHVGDEISFTFNQDINCGKLIQANIFNANNVGLYDATSNNLIDASITCHSNKIVIEPNFQNKFFENKILRAELHNIEDLTGNKNVLEEWEFYVDRNELAWLEDSIELTKFVDETKTISAKIHNRGGYPVPFIITAPPYVHVTPDRGTLVANEVEEIFFTVDQNQSLGNYTDSIILHTETGLNPFFMGGDEVLNMNTRIICRPPAWVLNPSGFDPSDYSFSMNMVVELNIEGDISTDKEDIVGAYVNGALRGIARIEYNEAFNNHVAYLTVYSNTATGETVEFQIWDASDCRLFSKAIETYTFISDDIIGSAIVPQTLHTNGKILRRIYIHPGWNWISMNLELDDNLLNGALESLSAPEGALIKDQTTFSVYSNSNQSWLGSLLRIEPYSLYQYHSLSMDSILMTGQPIDITTPIPLTSGWNWIGYLPQTPLPMDVALASLNPTQGDIIKGQLSFAQYYNGVGWLGNLRFLDAPNGYLLKLANADTLSYPNVNTFTNNTSSRRLNMPSTENASLTAVDETKSESHWSLDVTKYEHTMNIIAVVSSEGGSDNILSDYDEVAAFVDNEVRGSSKAYYIPALKAYMVFMTAYANKEGEVLKFKFFDVSEHKIWDLDESTPFVINKVLGDIDTPQPLHISSTTDTEDISIGQHAMLLYPNPFTYALAINYTSKSDGISEIIITDALGNKVEERTLVTKHGANMYEWKPKSNLAGGTYFISIKNGLEVITQKVLYLK